MPFSVKQQEFLDNASQRWNFKQGATRSGKTYLDYYVIPLRIRRLIGKPGLVAILGVSKGTIQRNIVEPLQQIWGHKLVSDINSQNKCYMFGEWVYCLGAEKINQVAKLQGSSIKYCYGDETAKWNKEVFNMLKSRLDKPYSCFDGTCNPEYPTHWLKEFMDSDMDIYCQKYTIFDNPFLDKNFVEQLCKEYFGTVLYDRFIMGEWKQAEGLCYPKFADSPKDYILNDVPTDIIFGQIGLDFGGNGSGHSFQLTGFSQGLKKIITLEEHYHDNKKKGIISPTQLEQQFIDFVKMCKSKYKFVITDVYADSAEQTLIAGLKSTAIREHLAVEIHNAHKGEIIDRIRLYNCLIAQHMFKVFQKGADDGTISMDKVGDAVKEFNTRSLDGSKSTAEGFGLIGLNADDMAAKFTAGGDTAKEAFQQTIDALAEMEDPLAQSKAGADLFGSAWSDLGPEALSALGEIQTGAYDTNNALAGIKEVKYDDVSSMLDGLKRNAELLIAPLGEQLMPIITDLIEAIMPVVKDLLPPIVDFIGSFVPPLGEVVESILPPLIEFAGTLAESLKPVIEKVMPVIIDLMDKLLPPLISIVESVLPPICDALGIILDPLLELIEVLLPPLADLLEVIGPLFKALAPYISDAAKYITDQFKVAIDVLKPIVENTITYFKDLIKFVTDIFKGNWKGAWDDIVNIFKDIFNQIPALAEGIMNSVINVINNVITGVNDITEEVGIKAIPTIPNVTLPRLKIGLDYVPADDMPALLHKGEAVLTAEEATIYRGLGGKGSLQRMAFAAQTSSDTMSNNKSPDTTVIYNQTIQSPKAMTPYETQKYTQQLLNARNFRR